MPGGFSSLLSTGYAQPSQASTTWSQMHVQVRRAKDGGPEKYRPRSIVQASQIKGFVVVGSFTSVNVHRA